MNIYWHEDYKPESVDDRVGPGRTISDKKLWRWLNDAKSSYGYITPPSHIKVLEQYTSLPTFDHDSISFCKELSSKVDYAAERGLFDLDDFGGQEASYLFRWGFAKDYLGPNYQPPPVDPMITIHRQFTKAIYFCDFVTIRALLNSHGDEVKFLYGDWLREPFPYLWDGIIERFFRTPNTTVESFITKVTKDDFKDIN